MSIAIVIRQPNKVAQAKGKRRGARVVIADGWEMPAERVLFAAPSVEIPYGLLGAGFHFIERWEVAAPLWRYGVLAADLGGKEDQERTRAIVRDLRVPVYAHELLFARDCDGARQLLEVWRAECADGGDERLAFLRALGQVKPLFLALPRSWLQEIPETKAERAKRRPVLAPRVAQQLIKVEIAPGRFVRCRPGEEERVKARFEHLAMRRSERRKQGAH